MEKGVLLVLLCLSFLLVTAFTATDAAALVEENQRQRTRERLCPYLRPCLVTPGRPKFGLGWTAADAAALAKENRKQQPSLCIYLGPCPATTVNPNSGLGCLGKSGACNIFNKEHQTTVQPELSKQHKTEEIKSILQ